MYTSWRNSPSTPATHPTSALGQAPDVWLWRGSDQTCRINDGQRDLLTMAWTRAPACQATRRPLPGGSATLNAPCGPARAECRDRRRFALFAMQGRTPMARSLTVVLATLPMSAWYLQGAQEDVPLLLFLYMVTAAGFCAWFAVPYIDWAPDTLTLFAVTSGLPGD
jgi:hypothetical protein